jgi:hypothetical protein
MRGAYGIHHCGPKTGGDNFFRIGLELGKASRFNSHTEKHEEYFCKGKAASSGCSAPTTTAPLLTQARVS